jgi:hypothetical protein
METIGDKAVWERFVDESPDGTIFHRWDFLKIVEKYTKYQLYPYGIYQDGLLICIIPFFLCSRRGLKLMLSPPEIPIANVPYLGFATSPEICALKPHDKISTMNRVIGVMHEELKKLSNSICLGLNPSIKDVRPFEWHDYEIDQQYTYVINLDKTLKEIWEGFDRDCKKNINECMKHDLTYRVTSDVDTFNNILKNGLSRYGDTFYHRQDPAYIKELMAAFPENIKLYFYYQGDEIVGVKLNMGYKKHYLSWMGNVAVQKTLNVNEFFYWEMIKKAKSEGYEIFENYGTIDRNLNDFKSKFNPILEPCFYVQKKDAVYRAAELSYQTVSGLVNFTKVNHKMDKTFANKGP